MCDHKLMCSSVSQWYLPSSSSLAALICHYHSEDSTCFCQRLVKNLTVLCNTTQYYQIAGYLTFILLFYQEFIASMDFKIRYLYWSLLASTWLILSVCRMKAADFQWCVCVCVVSLWSPSAVPMVPPGFLFTSLVSTRTNGSWVWCYQKCSSQTFNMSHLKMYVACQWNTSFTGCPALIRALQWK